MDFDMEKKYKLTDETIKIDGHILHRIQASKDFNDVKKGDLGGFIEKEENLAHYGTCWIYDNACVYENAIIHMNANIYADANIFGQASIWSNAKVEGNAKIYGNAYVCGNAYITGHANIYGNSVISDNSIINGYAEIYDNAEITGEAEIQGNAKVCKSTDYIVFKNFWSSGRYFTWTRSNNLWKVGCFLGTGKELIKKAYSNSETSGKEYERIVKYVESILADEEKTT